MAKGSIGNNKESIGDGMMIKILAGTPSRLASFYVGDGEKKGIVHMVAMPRDDKQETYHYAWLQGPEWVDRKEFANRLQNYLNKSKKEME